ncbi:hypothetical protein BC940DRAFT_310950 [Gongronella butleri]|nr:hypothetical protein BC940DRAFT_310950 [Gongronella butleri]
MRRGHFINFAAAICSIVRAWNFRLTHLAALNNFFMGVVWPIWTNLYRFSRRQGPEIRFTTIPMRSRDATQTGALDAFFSGDCTTLGTRAKRQLCVKYPNCLTSDHPIDSSPTRRLCSLKMHTSVKIYAYTI